MALFPEPERVPHSLSRMYSGGEWRAVRVRPQWSNYNTKRGMPCDECFALQHEDPTRLVRARNYATKKRSLGQGKDLYLCGAHAMLWKERDG